MARKKKNEFWDDVAPAETASLQSDSRKPVQDEWSATRSTPIKVIMRIILMISCLAALLSAYISYQYVSDRNAGGSYSDDYFSSNSFASEYNNSIAKLLDLVNAMEAEPTVTDAGNEELLGTMVENYMGKDTNFAFLIQDQDHYLIASSGDDAKERIESSNHYALITNADGEFDVKSTLKSSMLKRSEWEKILSETSESYYLYTAVDNELTYKDNYYQSRQNFQRTGEYFKYARIAGIVAAVIFIISLIFCIMATGMKRGYDEVQLSWFDRVFTEFAVIIMAAVAVGLIYAQRRLMGMDGVYYRYGSIALIVVIYAWIIRSYFSIVRRIKAHRLLRKSLIGTIIGGVAKGVGKLPSPLNIIVGAIILIAINGAMVYGVLYLRQYTYKDIPIMYIVAPVVFVIELLALLVHNSSKGYEEDGGSADSYEDGQDDYSDASAEDSDMNGQDDVSDSDYVSATGQDWEDMDLGRAIADAEKEHTGIEKEPALPEETLINVREREPEKKQNTVVLSPEEMEQAIIASGLTPSREDFENRNPEPVKEPKEEKTIEEIKVPVNTDKPVQNFIQDEDEGRVNFVQLNKDVRTARRAELKNRGITVTVRAPEKPVIIDIDRTSLHLVVDNIFSQMLRLSADNTRNYAEVYLQNGKVVYIVRITIAEGMEAAAAASISDDSFTQARKVIEANDGRFIVNCENGQLKIGVLIDQ